MTIILSPQNFNSILKVCKGYVLKNTTRPVLTQIKLVCDGSEVTASAVDGVKTIVYSVRCEEGSETGELLMPVVKPVDKKALRVVITDSTDSDKNPFVTIEVETVGLTQTNKHSIFKGDFFACDKVFSTKTAPYSVSYFDPKLLAEALTAFANCEKGVKIESYGKNGIVITDLQGRLHVKALVMPVRGPKTEN